MREHMAIMSVRNFGGFFLASASVFCLAAFLGTHQLQIDRLFGQTQIKGHTLVALRLYWKGHRVKIEIGVAKGKEASDKRQDLKAKAAKRETDREVARFNKKHA